MIKYIENGDIFSIEEVNSFAHGCNCAGSMGHGIAVQFRKKFPEMFEKYRQMCLNGKFLPGDVYDFDYGMGHVYNLATQLHYCVPWQLAKLEHIETSMRKMMLLAEIDKVQRIALPKIGAGHGGLRWQDVKSIIEKVAANHQNVDLYIVENFVEYKELRR